jgi:predicted DNA-binding transcriptional regulator YafY
VPSPTARLLELLELLQGRPRVSGEEIARRLGTDPRTVRRDIAALQSIGIPVEGVRGVGGGYALRPGYRMPPLMLTADEAVAVVLGLSAVRRSGLGDLAAAERADRKLRRVLPERLADQVRALQTVTSFTGRAAEAAAPHSGTALALAEAIDRAVRVRIRYADGPDERELSPHGLVVHSGRWYLAAYDHGREDERTFRVDRVRSVTPLTGGAQPPAEPDTLARVSRALARVPWGRRIEAVLDLPLAAAQARLPPTLAELTPDGDRTVLVLQAESLEWAVTVLAGLGCGVKVTSPPECREALRRHAARLADC